MGAAMGQDCAHHGRGLRVGDVGGQSPRLGQADAERHAASPPAREAALAAGCQGVSAINTILCVMGVDLETLRPEPTVEGYTVPGGYSCLAIRPIALRMVKECAEVIRDKFPGRSLSGIGGDRERRRRGAVHPARRRHGAGLHRRHEDGLRLHPPDEGRPARLHGPARLRDDLAVQGQQPAILHDPRRPGATPGRGEGRRGGRAGRSRSSRATATGRGRSSRRKRTPWRGANAFTRNTRRTDRLRPPSWPRAPWDRRRRPPRSRREPPPRRPGSTCVASESPRRAVEGVGRP